MKKEKRRKRKKNFCNNYLNWGIVLSILRNILSILLLFFIWGVALLGVICANKTLDIDNTRNDIEHHIENIVPLKSPQLKLPIQYMNVSNVYNRNEFRGENSKESYVNGWIKEDVVYIHSEPNFSSSITGALVYNEVVEFTPIPETKEWVKIKFMDITGYILTSNLSLEKNIYIDFEIPTYSGFKSYMDYRTVTTPTSAQYNLLNNYGYSDGGFRKVDGRYCIAVGSYFNTSIGQYIDLILENGIVIKCIMGDLKANIHTEDNNIFTSANKCCSEFIIDINTLDSYVAKTGNISKSNPSWDSPVKYIRVYNENVFDE